MHYRKESEHLKTTKMTEYFEKASKSTLTTILLLPAIGLSRRSLLKYGFINAYLADIDAEIKFKDCVYLLFRPDSIEKFEAFFLRERTSENFVTQYDYEGGYIVLVYSILDKFKEDYKIFLEGKYSQFSTEYRETFPKFVRVINPETGQQENQISLQFHIINKSAALKNMWEEELKVKFKDLGEDMEVWEKYNIHKETLDIEQIRKEQR
jgi:hypothetical protein